MESGAVHAVLHSMQSLADLRPESVDHAASLLLAAAERNAQVLKIAFALTNPSSAGARAFHFARLLLTCLICELLFVLLGHGR